jgi:hypothetical protein
VDSFVDCLFFDWNHSLNGLRVCERQICAFPKLNRGMLMKLKLMRKQKQKSCFEIIREDKSFQGQALTELDGDVSLQLVLEANCVDARNGFHDRRLSVSYMTDCANVDCCLSRYHLW